MNDRYSYKAKRKDNSEWVEGNLVWSDDADDDYKAIIIPTTRSNMFTRGGTSGDLGFEKWYRIDPSTLCQCTGLRDKNRKLIWENDIVYAKCNGLSGYGVIKYDKGSFVLIDKKRNRNYSLFGEWKFRVDGNIFDNPELLKGEIKNEE